MGYQRAKWHSGLTYQQICETCKKTVTYTDHKLDYRPWYADGYVDCPTCGTHLRHNEKYAVSNADKPKEEPSEETVGDTAEGEAFSSVFCHNCGNQFGEGHRFCFRCGAKRS